MPVARGKVLKPGPCATTRGGEATSFAKQQKDKCFKFERDHLCGAGEGNFSNF